jgi:surface polysaccharide O-acyltransferase-like enzyme
LWGSMHFLVGRVGEAIVLSARRGATGAHHPAPFWFIPMIAVLYLAAPLLLAIDRHPKLYLGLPALIAVSMLCHRPIVLTDIGQSLLYFAPTYLVGMWLSHDRERILAFVDRAFVPLAIASAATMMFDILVLGSNGAIFSASPFSTEHGVLDLDVPVKLVWSILLISFLRRHDATFRRPLDYIAGASFGIFFVHPFVIDLLDLSSPHIFTHGLPPGWVGIVGFTPLVSAVSISIVWLTRRALGARSRYVIGC